MPIDFKDSIVFYLVPPGKSGIKDTRIKKFLELLPPSKFPKKIILISTTGVYGDCRGEWVDETRKPNPLVDRSQRRLDAENTLVSWCNKKAVDYLIFRVPGIYGKDNLPIKRLQEKKPVLAISESPWSNRIHVDDLVQACIKAIDYSGKQHIFNISDGNPGTMTEYFMVIARLKGLPEPEQITLDECRRKFSENMMSYLSESKKIDNSAMIRELKIKLKYPSLEEALIGLD